MEPQANEQRRPLPLFTIITLNTNKLADLAGLPTLLRENRPDFVFLQEVSVPLERLRAAVGGLGYSVWLSSADQPKRVIAVLSLHPEATVSNLIPGYLQKVIFEDIALLHLHAPSNSVIQNKIVFFQLKFTPNMYNELQKYAHVRRKKFFQRQNGYFVLFLYS